MKRRILVIAGASGAGKTTVMAAMLKRYKEFGLVRSVTTRAPRGDGHDSEYIYLDREEFMKRALGGELVEYMQYGDNMYGTPLSELKRIFDEGKIPLLILDIEGVKSLRKREFDFTPYIVYLWEELSVIEERLYERDVRNSPTEEKIKAFEKRKAMNRRDYLSMPEIYPLFDLFIKNEGIEISAERINEAMNNAISDTEKKGIAEHLAASVN